ncbi:hypothetical protein D9M68_767230 [compost metagenome]
MDVGHQALQRGVVGFGRAAQRDASAGALGFEQFVQRGQQRVAVAGLAVGRVELVGIADRRGHFHALGKAQPLRALRGGCVSEGRRGIVSRRGMGHGWQGTHGQGSGSRFMPMVNRSFSSSQ